LNNQHTTVVPGDTFHLYVKVVYHSSHTDSEGLQNQFSTLLIPSHDFFREGQILLQSLLSGLSFSIEAIEEITEGVVSTVQELFEVGFLPLESQHRIIPLSVTIIILDNVIHAVGEVSRMKQSDESIIKRFLKKRSVMQESEDCCICLEDLDMNCECYTMPCHHHFHLHCILTWLKTSRVCPLCRYPLPTLEN